LRLELGAVSQQLLILFGNKTPLGKISFFIQNKSKRFSCGVILIHDSFLTDENFKNLLPLRGERREAKADFSFRASRKTIGLKSYFLFFFIYVSLAQILLFVTLTSEPTFTLKREKRKRIQSSACDTGVFVFTERRAMTFQNFSIGNSDYTIKFQLCTSRDLIFPASLLTNFVC